jgi:hypothetical protein
LTGSTTCQAVSTRCARDVSPSAFLIWTSSMFSAETVNAFGLASASPEGASAK